MHDNAQVGELSSLSVLETRQPFCRPAISRVFSDVTLICRMGNDSTNIRL